MTAAANPVSALEPREIDPETLPAATRPRRKNAEPPPAERADGEFTIGGYRILYLPPGGRGDLPEGCPVTALGYKRELYFFLTADHGFKAIRDKDFSKLKFMSLYSGDNNYLMALWPRYTKEGKVTSFHADLAAGDHMAACSKAGPWDPSHSLRGAGAWRGADGDLIWNLGDETIVRHPVTKSEPPWTKAAGPKIGEHIYLRVKKQVRPWGEAVGAADAKVLLAGLQTWNWARGELDARLLLGWIVSAMMGGALAWRPLIWITGDKGTGKSTLNDWLEYLFGTHGLVRASDATAAGIWQSIEFDSLPVALDEVEAAMDNRKTETVLNLARQASSGGLILRGGQDHAGVEFTARSCFSFSSINIPPLAPQDRSRLAILELGKLPDKAAPPLKVEALHELGSKLRRRILDLWPQWDARFAAWREGLATLGHSARTADQFGTLLAAADLVLEDKTPTPKAVDKALGEWGMARLAEQADDVPDWQHLLAHLRTVPVQIQRGAETTIAHQIELHLGRVAKADDDTSRAAEAQRAAGDNLAHFGLKILERPDPERDGRASLFLAVSNDAKTTERLFTGTHWGGRSGALPVYVGVLRRVPGALYGPEAANPIMFRGHQSRVTLLPLDVVMPIEPER